jgi:hypothetical protein
MMVIRITAEEYWAFDSFKQFVFDKWLTRRYGSGWLANQIESITWDADNEITVVGIRYKPGWDDTATPSPDPVYWCEVFRDTTAPSPYGPY